VGVGHYENFPVASVLCPPRLRPAVAAIYHFARTADDIADEGNAPAAERLADLAAYRRELDAALGAARGASPGSPPDAAHAVADPGALADSSAPTPPLRWPQVFGPLAEQARAFALPGPLLHALLDAFEQDVRNPPYADRAAVLDYCSRSANPLGRLLLHLYGIGDARSLAQSDAICSALQLINFWQDLSRDGPAGRCYVPASDQAAFGVTRSELAAAEDSPRARALVAALCGWARALMLEGAPLALRVPGRAGWELRLVVQGGLRVLARIEAMDHATLSRRPALGLRDLPPMLWRALRMRAVGR
jgi:squalene synthase HpnC